MDIPRLQALWKARHFERVLLGCGILKNMTIFPTTHDQPHHWPLLIEFDTCLLPSEWVFWPPASVHALSHIGYGGEMDNLAQNRPLHIWYERRTAARLAVSATSPRWAAAVAAVQQSNFFWVCPSKSRPSSANGLRQSTQTTLDLRLTRLHKEACKTTRLSTGTARTAAAVCNSTTPWLSSSLVEPTPCSSAQFHTPEKVSSTSIHTLSVYFACTHSVFTQ